MRNTTLIYTSVFLLFFTIFWSAGCSDDPNALLLEVRTPADISDLEIRVKQYHDDESITLYPPRQLQIPGSWDGTYGYSGGNPLKLNITVPEAGNYAVHIVGHPSNVQVEEVFTTTTCHQINGVVFNDRIRLGILHTAIDTDGDTFPERSSPTENPFCEGQGNGFICDESCNVEAYSAMYDCNPDPDIPVPEGCNDYDDPNTYHPFSIDICDDCHDQDCFRGDLACEDNDGDGYTSGQDCNDNDPNINPGATEICSNGIDENCRTDVEGCTNDDLPCDEDNDGFYEIIAGIEGCGSDCDDTNPNVRPNALEGRRSDPSDLDARPNCDDGLDNDCDGLIDEGCAPEDSDNDGEPAPDEGEDCNDCNAAIGPGFPEICGNGIDEDCDGEDLPCSPNDTDQDGEEAIPAGYDCDDSNPQIFPGAPDYCGDGILQNCDSDNACSDITDADGDHFGAGIGDCRDDMPNIHPWAEEECENEYDDDCDGITNELLDHEVTTHACVLSEEDGNWHHIPYASGMDHCGECHYECCSNPNGLCRGDECEMGTCRCDGGDACEGVPTDNCCPGQPGRCVDLTSDESNCGVCGHACAIYGDEECCIPDSFADRGICITEPTVLGVCQCPHEPGPDNTCPQEVGMGCCPDAGCTNVNSDPNNCGGCGDDCFADLRGNECIGGNCHCTTGTGSQICNQALGEWCTGLPGREHEGECGCQNLNTDTSNCGACNAVCDPREGCVAGECSCPSTGENCAGTAASTCCPNDGCVNINTNRNHCGGCGNACDPNEICSGGRCICEASGTDCTGAMNNFCCPGVGCVNLNNNADHCGACNSGCDINEECASRNCRCPGTSSNCTGAANNFCCPGSGCVNTNNDEDHCGGCDASCGANEVCTSRTCTCPTGNTVCTADDYCRTPSQCCVAGDCGSGSWSCTGHNCSCSEGTCDDGYCPSGSQCCVESIGADCGGGDGWACTSHSCVCSGAGTARCGSFCADTTGGECCVLGDCGSGSGWACSSNSCSCSGGGTSRCGSYCADTSSGECCVTGDCGGGSGWSCSSHSCSCSGAGTSRCGSYCADTTSGQCCATSECNTSNNEVCNMGSHLCVCDTGYSDCSGTCIVTPTGGDGSSCCSTSDCGIGNWTCTSNSCGCAKSTCTDAGQPFCPGTGECCVDGDCGSGNCNESTHTCIPASK